MRTTLLSVLNSDNERSKCSARIRLLLCAVIDVLGKWRHNPFRSILCQCEKNGESAAALC